MIRTVDVKLPDQAYSIQIESGLLSRMGDVVRSVVPHKQCALILDSAIAESHGRAAHASLEGAGYGVIVAHVHASEADKSLASVSSIYESMLAGRLERGCAVVAVGGGITGDVAGFVAATYLRGLPIIQVPTTLLAMVDASVGGKTGVNFPLPGGGMGKNLIGAFWQPRAVLVDPNVLATLEMRHLCCGLAECIKHGMLGDADYFEFIEQNVDGVIDLNREKVAELIERAVSIKARIVEADERETGCRALLNLGHTFAHAIESMPANGLFHGEAVGVGLVSASIVATGRGWMTPEEASRVRSLIEQSGLPVSLGPGADARALMDAMAFDKKVAGGVKRLVLPRGIGAAQVVEDVTEEEILAGWRAVGAP